MYLLVKFLELVALFSIVSAGSDIFNTPSKREQSGRIVNGEPASFNDFPFMASLHLNVNDATGLCGGSLIAPNIVITNSFCLFNSTSTDSGQNTMPFEASQIAVGFGSERDSQSSENLYDVSKVVFYPGYDLGTLKDSIGLLILNKSVPSSVATPAVLYNQTISDGMSLEVAGFGDTTQNETRTFSKYLNFIKVQTSSSGKCEILGTSADTIDKDSRLCSVNTESKGICVGDYGSPLATADTRPRQLVGVVQSITVSGSPGGAICGTNGDAIIYINLKYYSSWLIDQIKTFGSPYSLPNNSTSSTSPATITSNSNSGTNTSTRPSSTRESSSDRAIPSTAVLVYSKAAVIGSVIFAFFL